MEKMQISEGIENVKIRGTKDIGAEEWEKLFKEQKASGKSIKQWCKENHVSTYAYYRRQRERIGSTRQEKPVKAVELVKLVTGQQRQDEFQSEKNDTSSKAQSVKISREDVSIEISIACEEEGIEKLLRVIRNAW